MASTKQEIRDKVLRFVRLLPEGQDATAEQTTIVEGVIDAAQAYLVSEEIAYWETSAIPDGVVNAYRGYIAALAAPELMDLAKATPYVGNELTELNKMRRFTAKANTQIKAVYY